MSHTTTILIVDDEERGRDALEMLLMTENYSLHFARDGKEALVKAAEISPDLVLLDVMMPQMDGFEVCQHLRANPQLAEVPIVMLTALDDRESKLRAIQMGADDFLSKPYDRIELRTRIATIARLNRYRRLVNEHSRFMWVVEQSVDGCVLLNEQREVIYSNALGRQYFAITEENYPISWDECTLKAGFNRQTVDSWRINEHTEVYYLVRPESGHSAALWLQVSELNQARETTKLLMLRNITEEINLHRQMWSFQKMISHKLRSPLNGLVSLQLLDANNLNNDRSKMLLQVAKESADRLQSQILEILSYTDVYASDTPSAFEALQVQQIAGLVKLLAEEVGIKQISSSIEPNIIKRYMMFSLEMMDTVLRELFNNALKFHPTKNPNMVVMISQRNNRLIIQVLDDGKGIANEDLQKIWQPYYQSERSFTGEVEGMGLGLAIISRLLWSYNGTCQITNRNTNNPNETGVCVEITLPVVEE